MKKIIVLSLALIFVVAGCSLNKPKTAQEVLGIEEAKAKVVDFINNNLMQPGSEVSVKEITEENNLYKVTVNMSNGQEITSYLTKDGKKFFPQAMDIEEVKKKNEGKEAQQEASEAKTIADISKNDKPHVELFIMSHCPYGTQIEKGILPVLDALGDKIDFELKFCDYAMHAKKELDEQLNQYCIQKNEPQKLISYLYCFLEADKTDECLTKVKINVSKLKSCISATDKQYKVTEQFNDKTTWKSGRFPAFDVHKEDNAKYGIKGSPGLVINGQKISSGRDANSLLKTICAGFDEAPEECSTKLSGAAPSPGFGFGKTGADSDGGCAE